jgi:Region found in RelA / SpoT proteins.
LKDRVDKYFINNIDKCWHYESRIKEHESYALKVETGRYSEPIEIDDFLACTIVVENLESLNKAEKLINKRFKVVERRPPDKNFTTKPSECFMFDDTRLYIRWRDNTNIPPTGLNDLLFEIQIKTFLAHAWSVATHDLTYKTDEKSWSKERIAFQIKAMLEHAETSIYEAKRLAKSESINKTDKLSARISEIIELMNELWSPDVLPKDKKRLAENIDKLINNIGIEIKILKKIMIKETELGRGTKTLNLSPYSTVIQSIFNQNEKKLISYLIGRKKEFKIYIPSEIKIPESLLDKELKNAIIDKGN